MLKIKVNKELADVSFTMKKIESLAAEMIVGIFAVQRSLIDKGKDNGKFISCIVEMLKVLNEEDFVEGEIIYNDTSED